MSSNLPFVSFLVPTHGRYPKYGYLLEELVYWFSVQTYPREHRELVLLNDAPNQKLVCHVPGVVVINAGKRAPSLGYKRNLLQDAARGDIILPWDDDDISLPTRATRAVASIGVFDYWNPGARWFEQGGKLHHKHAQNCTHHASAWRKAAGLRYRDITHGEDVTFEGDARGSGKAAPRRNAPVAEWDYVYRWGVSNLHLSAFPDQHTVYGRQTAEAGEFLIEPHMRRDYAAECAVIARSLAVTTCTIPTHAKARAVASAALSTPWAGMDTALVAVSGTPGDGFTPIGTAGVTESMVPSTVN